MVEEIRPLPTNLEVFSKVYEGKYFVSNLGYICGIRDMGNGGMLKPNNEKTASSVTLCGPNGFRKKMNVKFIVMYTFDYRPDYNEHTVFNMDGNKYNNSLDNLIWDDYTKFGNNVMILPKRQFDENTILENEIWRPVLSVGEMSDCDTRGYFVSNLGRARNYDNVLKGKEDPNEYNVLVFKSLITGNKKSVQLHRAIMYTFNYIDGCDKFFVNHKDGNKHNNRLDNLEWCTPKYNIHHAYSHSLSRQIGANHSESTIPSEAVHMILDLYLNKKMSNEKILNNTPDNIRKTFISDILLCRARLVDIIDYLTSVYGLESPYDVISKEDIDKIIECVDNGLSVTKTREFLNVEPNTIQFIIVGVLHYMVKHKTEWLCNGFIDHADLNMNMI